MDLGKPVSSFPRTAVLSGINRRVGECPGTSLQLSGFSSPALFFLYAHICVVLASALN